MDLISSEAKPKISSELSEDFTVPCTISLKTINQHIMSFSTKSTLGGWVKSFLMMKSTAWMKSDGVGRQGGFDFI